MLLEVLGCPDRNLTEGELVSGRHPILVNIAGRSTGIGWWTQALSSFSQQEGLAFDSGLVEKLDCHTDVFQASAPLAPCLTLRCLQAGTRVWC